MIFALRRILLAVPLLLAVSLAAYALIDALPGDPAAARFEKRADPGEVRRWRAERHLDDPFLARWARYVSGVALRLDFDRSYVDDRPVAGELLRKLQATVELTLFALLLAVAGGLLAGILSAAYPRTPIDYGVNLLALCGISMPVFWLGMLLILAAVNLFGFEFSSNRHSPDVSVEGFRTQLYLFESLVRLRFDVFRSCAKNLLLPSLALSTIPMAVLARMTRSAMLDEIRKDYATTARAKGLRGTAVVGRHVLRNALIPIVTAAGLQFGHLLGGAVLTETVFSWPGLGRFIVEKGVLARDTPIIVGGILLVSSTFVLVNLAVDLLYGVIDPRVRRS